MFPLAKSGITNYSCFVGCHSDTTVSPTAFLYMSPGPWFTKAPAKEAEIHCKQKVLIFEWEIIAAKAVSVK